MNISVVTQFLQSNNNKYVSPVMQKAIQQGVSDVNGDNLKPLSKDTVSFTGAGKKIVHAIEDNYVSNLPIFKAMGQKLLKTLTEICADVEGAVYDTEYCEKALNKTLERYIEKFRDSGSVPMDRVRSTIFIKDLYDLSITTNVIKALEKRGYYILPIPDKTSGKKVLSWTYDFDIRLDDVSPQEIKKLPTHLRELVSKKQKSGYGDIQMRIVDASGLPPNERTLHNLSKLIPEEIIIVFGKHTAEAKSNESKYVYNITRVLEKLHIIKDFQEGTISHKIKDSIDTIGSILRSNISKPLYRNAKMLDVYPQETILETAGLNKGNCSVLTGYMTELKNLVCRYYRELSKKIKSSEYDIEIEKMIKASPEYKARANKRVSDEEIILKREELLKILKENKKEDLLAVSEQTTAIQKTIEKYKISSKKP